MKIISLENDWLTDVRFVVFTYDESSKVEHTYFAGENGKRPSNDIS